jgi:hypothetical protein
MLSDLKWYIPKLVHRFSGNTLLWSASTYMSILQFPDGTGLSL